MGTDIALVVSGHMQGVPFHIFSLEAVNEVLNEPNVSLRKLELIKLLFVFAFKQLLELRVSQYLRAF